jgi:hypothetical protein
MEEIQKIQNQSTELINNINENLEVINNFITSLEIVNEKKTRKPRTKKF